MIASSPLEISTTMENYMNNQNEQTEEEIPNIEQFQVSRSSLEEKDLEDNGTVTEEEAAATADAGYTSEEVEFADGEGTQLDSEISDEPEEDEDDELEGDNLGDDEGL